MKEKNILAAVLTAVMAISLTMTVFAMEANAPETAKMSTTTISEAYIPSETFTLNTIDTSFIVGAQEDIFLFGESDLILIKEIKTEEVYEEEEFEIIEEEIVIESECNEIEQEKIQESYEEVTEWIEKTEEYADAAFIWNYMKNLGWSDAVCAGVMGNLMVEVGGQTLNIRYYLYDSSGYYYGMCQWNGGAYGSIHGAGLEAQCDFLRDTIQRELDIYGYAYQSGMDFAGFLELATPSEVATAFAMCYERCDSSTYGIRRSSAETAYEYFVN